MNINFLLPGYGHWIIFLCCFFAICFVGCSPLKENYEQEVKHGLLQSLPKGLLTEKDIAHLPMPVQKYIRYSKSLNKEKVGNFKITFSGKIRKDSTSGWMNLTSEQYNFVEKPTRLFYLKAIMKGLPVRGFHCYKEGVAFMDIRLFSFYKVQYQQGIEMGQSETVTFFNDMCCLAPATLIDDRIKWVEIDAHRVLATFTCKKIIISANLLFNDEGQLINFISDDRYAQMKDNTMKKFRWSTPLKNYKEIDGRMLPGYAETIYSYPEGDFCYGIFKIESAEYNCVDK